MSTHPYCPHFEGEHCTCDSEYQRPTDLRPNPRQESPEAYQRRLQRRRARREAERTT